MYVGLVRRVQRNDAPAPSGRLLGIEARSYAEPTCKGASEAVGTRIPYRGGDAIDRPAGGAKALTRFVQAYLLDVRRRWNAEGIAEAAAEMAHT